MSRLKCGSPKPNQIRLYHLAKEDKKQSHLILELHTIFNKHAYTKKYER